jgi:hypothetical protein
MQPWKYSLACTAWGHDCVEGAWLHDYAIALRSQLFLLGLEWIQIELE